MKDDHSFVKDLGQAQEGQNKFFDSKLGNMQDSLFSIGAQNNSSGNQFGLDNSNQGSSEHAEQQLAHFCSQKDLNVSNNFLKNKSYYLNK